ncbi:hypothetical protein [Cellulomonas sp. ICMP 17802]|uniref:alpha/beta hydrolase n=1 Tax=Cellulomonas sp. ICMP 17802 TaxID=3239199 RepID=UPI00351BCB8D
MGRALGTTGATVDGPLDPSLPIVVLLHGMGGDVRDMTAPLTSVFGSVAFNRAAPPPGWTSLSFAAYPPPLPIIGAFLDPPATSLTSWRDALLAAGFSTITYSQSGPLIANDVTQLVGIARAMSADPQIAPLRVAFVAHSRGGLVARSFLLAAAADATLTGFLGRTRMLVSLHSPHLGSGVASLAVTVDGLLATVQTSLTTLGAPPTFLTPLRSLVLNGARAELAIGAPTAAIAPGEPVPGIRYHTFGGVSTVFSRLWAKAFTPESYVPLPVPWPFFHWATSSLPIGAPLDAVSLLPLVGVLAPVPGVVALATALTTLVATTPELAPGSGDVLVSDARSRLPFATTHTTNALNHLEALYDLGLQAQVVTLLSSLRVAPPPPVTPTAIVRIAPYPARAGSTPHTVTAKDATTGASIAGTVTVRTASGAVGLTVPVGQQFTYSFAPRRTRVLADDGRWDWELSYPSATAALAAPYGTVAVDLGLP